MDKTERFALVMTPLEKAAVSNLAEEEGGLTQAALVRRLIRKAAKEQGIWGLPLKHTYKHGEQHGSQ